jgi:glutamate-ammonia-ligase adenylyltransferase
MLSPTGPSLNLPRFGGVFFAALAAIPAPLRAPVLRWFERAADEPAYRDLDARLPMRWLAELPRVIAASEFAAAALLQDPGALTWLWHGEDSASAVAGGGRALAATTETEAVFELRVWRRREMLRIAWREVTGRASVAQTLHDLSDLADAAIVAAVQIAARLLSPAFGTPRSRCGGIVPMIVLGMGKLGGRELNFSSDIDLILLFAEEGETDGPRAAANEEYFQRLGSKFIRLLDQRTDQGFVFRVDMRLRPFGQSGPLVVSLAALGEYLQQHGRDWERYAWLKARPIVAADAYAATYQNTVKPFVYRRYLDFGVFESLRDMKALIAREVARRELDQDLKLGKGGIREVEFIVQSFQLVRGGGDRRLQSPSLLDVLPRLAGAKLLPRAVVDELRAAYCLLRRAENLIQIIRDEQTHALPEGEIDRLRLAAGLRVDSAEPYDWPAAAAAIEAARESAAKAFEALVFGGPEGPLARADADLDWLAQDGGQLAVELAGIGFPAGEIAAVTTVLESYRDAAPYAKLDEVGRRRLRVILDRLLRAAATAASPVVVTSRVLRILEAIGARSSYLALLKEQPPALARLIDVCAISGFLARQIADYPLLLDELIDVNAFEELPSRAGFAHELAARTERLPPGDPERQVEALRQFQKAAVFSVALADLTGRLPLMRVSDRLTDIAELIVQCCLDLAWEQMTASYGVPECGDEDALRVARVAVIGYGKLGGIELGYGSDLDLVFLHDSAGEIQQTRGDRPIDNGVFFLRLGQRIVHLLTMHSASGRLYEVDMRLRPNGKGGFLMTGIEAFERYQHDDAWTWEHQALLRARAVAGDAALCARFSAARRRALSVDVRRETLRADVLEMRLRMRRELSRAQGGRFDIKQDAGGLADIEFLVQYWVLAAAHRHPQVVTFTDNIRQLETLSHYGVVPPETAQWLMEAYRGYRAVLHRSSLEGEGERVVDAAAHAETRARIGAIWQATFGEPQ